MLAALFVATMARAEDPMQADIHESVVHVPVDVRDIYNKEYRAEIPVTIYRPDGPGPFPLLILNHGRGPAEVRIKLTRARYDSAGRFFVRKGFVVVMPTRLGNGDQPELGDPEKGQSCGNPQFAVVTEAAVAQAEAVIAYMQKLPYIDPDRLVVAGQSVGGLMAVALTAKRPRGLIASINFAGGHGGDPLKRPGEPCQPGMLRDLVASYATQQAGLPPMPMLWVYTENDLYFAPPHSKAWYDAYVKNGGKADYVLLPAFGENGHYLFSGGSDIWEPLVENFLGKYGFPAPGIVATPPATQFAKLDDVDALPYMGAASKALYQRFLAAKKPRAFALRPNHSGFATGNDAKSRALGFCQRVTGLACRLYAVDDDVVWQP